MFYNVACSNVSPSFRNDLLDETLLSSSPGDKRRGIISPNDAYRAALYSKGGKVVSAVNRG
jgi:hypothetical protein